jgi:Ulp1 family protease
MSGPQNSLWLDDTCVNTYLEIVARFTDGAYTLNMSLDDLPKKSTLILNSFFYEHLKRGGSASMWLAEVPMERIRMVLFPIFESSHWSLGVIYPSGQSAVVMDSMRPLHSKCVFVINQYLGGDRTVYDLRALQQENANDCGLFACYFAESLLLSQRRRTDSKTARRPNTEKYRRRVMKAVSTLTPVLHRAPRQTLP